MTTPCRVSILTPAGRAAVATIVIEGSKATDVVSGWFQTATGSPLADQPQGRILFGRWRQPSGSMEEVVLCRRGLERIEIHCHGGQAATAAIVASLCSSGCVKESWESQAAQWESDQFIAAARIALATARTERTAAILLDQYRGALSRAIHQLIELIQQNQGAALLQVDQLLQHAQLGLHLTTPWRVVLAGQPNVGKSSLSNALLGYERSIVHEQPGTTRDVLASYTVLEGWPIELADTAGLRVGGGSIEAQGIQRAQRILTTADLAVLVFDASSPWSAEDQALLDSAPHGIIVHNKRDLAVTGAGKPEGLYVSALTGDGLDTLVQAISQQLVPAPPAAGAAVPFTSQQYEQLQQVRIAITAGATMEALGRLKQMMQG